jgi:hypothetical protein
LFLSQYSHFFLWVPKEVEAFWDFVKTGTWSPIQLFEPVLVGCKITYYAKITAINAVMAYLIPKEMYMCYQLSSKHGKSSSPTVLPINMKKCMRISATTFFGSHISGLSVVRIFSTSTYECIDRPIPKTFRFKCNTVNVLKGTLATLLQSIKKPELIVSGLFFSFFWILYIIKQLIRLFYIWLLTADILLYLS